MGYNRIWDLAYSILNDENGISEDAYDALIDVVRESVSEEAAVHLSNIVDATDGRFYIGEDVALDDISVHRQTEPSDKPTTLMLECKFSGWCNIDARDVLLHDTRNGEVDTAQKFYEKFHGKTEDFMYDIILYDFAALVRDASEIDYVELDLELNPAS